MEQIYNITLKLSFEENLKQLCAHYHMHTPSCHDCVTGPDDKNP